MVFVGDQKGKNIVQITGAKVSALPHPCQRQATGYSNPVKAKVSAGHAKS